MPETPEKDPVVSQSLAGFFLVSALLLVASLGWALYDEFFGLRPWKSYQRSFAERYSRFLEKKIPRQAAAEKEIRASAEFQALDHKLKEVEDSVGPKLQEIDRQAASTEKRLSKVTGEYTTLRAYVGSVIYRIEHTSSPDHKKSIENGLDKYKKGPFELELPTLDGGTKLQEVSWTFQELEEEFNRLRELKARLLAEKAAALQPVTESRKKRDTYLQERLGSLTADQLKGLLAKAQSSRLEIKQLNNSDAGIVDRCESCHLGIRDAVVLTRKDMGGEKDGGSAAFTSHPEMELLRIHNPETFGCTPCHNGNGMQVQSVKAAHGQYKHWLWPLYSRETSEAGCQQCHARDMVMNHAPVLSLGKELFQWRGCVGCHRFEGFDPEPEELLAVQQQRQQLEGQRRSTLLEIERSTEEFNNPATADERARELRALIVRLPVEISDIDAEIEQLDYRAKNLLRDMKKVGPDLKEARVKLRPEWIPEWIKDPHAFRPTTRMPQFRLERDEVKAIAGFIWQEAIDAKLPAQPRGDPVRGKESFESRGCMGCHAVGEGSNAVGGTFGANLTRVGEKVNYDYLVRWIHNPRERTRPYCPYEKRDLTEADYKKKGLPYVFDLDHDLCPNDGHPLQVEQMTVMPNLRLSWQESRDIASYLMTLKSEDAAYDPAPFLNNPKLKDEGKRLVRQYGCAGCHEIAGLEEEGRIGTELTKEGSKPIDQIDFGLFKTEAKRHGWFNHKGFFERKLEKPDLFDQGLVRKPEERLRMPNLHLKPEEKVALTTFLLGSVDSQVPPRYFYLPEDHRRDIQEGWWLVKKYNCQGCHQFDLGQPSVMMTLARFQTPEGKEQLPPRLLSEGARVNPEWLARFLANPAMSERDTDRNGIRPYLKARMPTFYLSPLEIRKLVRFFQALNSQPIPYIPPKLERLTNQEMTLARALFTSRAAPCLKCHATGDPSHDRFATAPNFLLAPERLKPGWTRRWILDPAMIDPGTAMPSGLFKREGPRWVFSGPTPATFRGYARDHAELLVRYMFEITAEEQRRLIGMSRTGGSVASDAGREALPRPRTALSEIR